MSLNFLKKPPALILTIFLILQASVFYGFSRGSESIPPALPLNQFPTKLGSWQMVQQGVIEQEVKDILRADDYVTRYYSNSRNYADLFVAYFKSQRAGQTPHSPKNCLPGSGWIWTVSDTVSIQVPSRAEPIVVNRYIVSKDEDRAVVLYWYQSRDRVVASEYRAAALSVADALRYNHTDTALVRVTVPYRDPKDQQKAYQAGVQFIQTFFGTLRQFFPA